jgi:hypothetical protein
VSPFGSLLNRRRIRAAQPAIVLEALASLSITLDPGEFVDIPLEITRVDAFGGDVSLAAEGLPTGVSAAFTPAVLTGAETEASVRFTAAADAPAVSGDVFTLRATATDVADSTVDGDATVTSLVTPTIGISLNASTISVPQGESRQLTVTGNWDSTTDPITLSVSGLPAGLSGSFSAPTLTPGSPTAQLTLTAAGGATLVSGDPFQVRGTAPGVTDATADAQASIIAPSFLSGDFNHIDGDNFADDADLQAKITANYNMIRNGETANKSLITLDSTILFRSKKTLRASFNGTAHPELFFRWGTGIGGVPGSQSGPYQGSGYLPDVWMRHFMRFKPGFTTYVDPAYSGAASLKWSGVSIGESGRAISLSNTDKADGLLSPTGNCMFEMRVDGGGLGSVYFAPFAFDVSSMWQSGGWWEYLTHYVWLSNFHCIARQWVTEVDPTTGLPLGARVRVGCLNQQVGNGTARYGMGYKPIRNFNGPYNGVTQFINYGDFDFWNGADDPDPFGLGDSATIAAETNIAVTLDNPTLSIARGSADTRVLGVARGTALAAADLWVSVTNNSNYTEQGPIDRFPAGLTISASPQALPSGVNSSTLTFTVASGATPGVYAFPLYVCQHKSVANRMVNGFVTVTLTIT